MDYTRLFLFFSLGVLPCLVWLYYYLKKDLDPEPRKTIIKVFLYGSLITVPVFFVQVGLTEALKWLQPYPPFSYSDVVGQLVNWFIVISLTEEIFKYLVVKWNVFGSKDLDEPTDLMIYMIISALGFAAVENILYIFNPADNVPLAQLVQTALAISFIRFIGGTFLHTLCSAALGYFIAVSFRDTGKRYRLFSFGFLMVIAFHGLFDASIMMFSSPYNLLIPILILIQLYMFVVYAFSSVKKIKSVCEVDAPANT